MNVTGPFPYPDDDPETIRGLSRGLADVSGGVNDTLGMFRSGGSALMASWQSGAGERAVTAVDGFASHGDSIATAVANAQGPLDDYANALETTRAAIDDLNFQANQAAETHAAVLSEPTGTPEGAQLLRTDANAELEATSSRLQGEYSTLMADLDRVATTTGGALSQMAGQTDVNIFINSEGIRIKTFGRDDRVSITLDRLTGWVIVYVNGRELRRYSPEDARKLTIETGGGNDIVNIDPGLQFGIKVEAGDGNDIVAGGGGADVIDGGRDHDILIGAGGDDRVVGGEGYDRMYDGFEDIPADVLAPRGMPVVPPYAPGAEGTTVAAALTAAGIASRAGSGNDSYHGGAGNDLIGTGAGNDTVFGDEDHDTIALGDGDDTAYGEEGNDKLHGGLGQDMLIGNAGNDTLHGDGGNDSLHGNDGNDTAYGGAGNDSLDGNDGDDMLYGDEGDDTGHGGLGQDIVVGNLGNDTLHGDDGNDMVDGSEGDDTISGDAGDDWLYGHDGNDTVSSEPTDSIVDPGVQAPPDRPVQVGESFWTIAQKEVTQANGGVPPTKDQVRVYWAKLIEANSDRLVVPGNPNILKPGQKLVIPKP